MQRAATSWAAAEFKDIDLGDQRLNKRAVLLAERLAEKPTASIPSACGGWAETAAAYRFLAQDELDWRDILAPHWQSSAERMRACEVVLSIQDTTELDFNGQTITGLGPLSYEAQRGLYLHPTYAVTPSREPLGVLDAYMWAREPKGADGVRPGIKESTRWTEGYERVAEQAAALPATRLVYVADRESDITALMVKAKELGHRADWLLRSQHNRTLPGGGKLWDQVTAGEAVGRIHFTLAARQAQPARAVRQQVWTQRVALPDAAGGVVNATCIVAREVDPPAGVKPIEWRLLSNREVDDLDAAAQLIDWYRALGGGTILSRAQERLSGRGVATRIDARLERALALFIVVAWRIARLMRLGRTCPELDAQLLFEPDEWQAAYILNRKEPPAMPPSLNEVVRLVARLGGFLARKGDGEPGVKTIWHGLQRVMDFAAGIKYAREIGHE